MKVLIVEDNSANQLMVSACCTAAGVEPTIVADGAAAVSAVQAFHYDLVLMDVHMPVMDGIMATTIIRGSPGVGEQPLIFGLTGDISPDTKAACLAAGMQEVLPKPLRLPQLSAVLNLVRNGLSAKPNVAPPQAITKTEPSASTERRLAAMRSEDGPASAARIHCLNLDALKEKLGPNWPKVADRVEQISEHVIAHHLDTVDCYEKYGPLDFNIVFARLNSDAGALKCRAIARDIVNRLIGEEGLEEFEVRAEMKDPKSMTGKPSPSQQENDLTPVGIVAAKEVVDRRPIEYTATAPIGFDPLDGLQVQFEPIWDNQRRKFPIRRARPVFLNDEAGAAQRALEHDGAALERLDSAVLACFGRSLDGYGSLESPALLSMSVHYQTLAKPASRFRFAQSLRQIPQNIRGRLVVEILRVPRGLLQMRLAEIQAPLIGLCLNTSACVDLSFRDFDVLRQNKIVIIGHELDTQLIQMGSAGLSQFLGAAQRAGLTPYVSNVASRSLFEALESGVRYLSGPAVAALQTRLENRLPLEP